MVHREMPYVGLILSTFKDGKGMAVADRDRKMILVRLGLRNPMVPSGFPRWEAYKL